MNNLIRAQKKFKKVAIFSAQLKFTIGTIVLGSGVLVSNSNFQLEFGGILAPKWAFKAHFGTKMTLFCARDLRGVLENLDVVRCFLSFLSPRLKISNRRKLFIGFFFVKIKQVEVS